MSLVLASAQPWMWDELWLWQAEHVGGVCWEPPGDPPIGGPVVRRPNVPDRAFFVGRPDAEVGRGALIAGVGLHEARSYVFLDDLTTNPAAPGRDRLQAVELVLKAAQQYAVSVGKPICAFTAVPSLYRIARRLGFAARPAGALLVFADRALPLGPPAFTPREEKNRRPPREERRSTGDGEKRPGKEDTVQRKKFRRRDENGDPRARPR